MSEEKTIAGLLGRQGVATAPACPKCGGELKKHMNKPAGERVYCANCNYPEQDNKARGVTIKSKDGDGATNISKTGVKTLSNHGS